MKARREHRFVVFVTHLPLSRHAVNRVMASDVDVKIVTDTISLFEAAVRCGKIRQPSLDRFLGEAIWRVSNEESVSAMTHVSKGRIRSVTKSI